MRTRSCPIRDDPPVDLRETWFTAALTTTVLTLALAGGSGLLLVAQASAFALGACTGLRFAPYSVLYRRLLAPRLQRATERRDAAPVRLAQGVGMILAVVGALGYHTGLGTLGDVAAVLAIVTALLDAAAGFGLGRGTTGRLAEAIGPADNHDHQGAIA